MKKAGILAVAVFTGSGCVGAASLFYPLDPKSSFVQADLNDSDPLLPDQMNDPFFIAVTPGTPLILIAEGLICWAGTNAGGNNASPCYGIGNPNISVPETQAEVGGVFSSDTNFLDDSHLQRIPEAVSSGQPDFIDRYYTTFYFDRSVSTINPFDFLIPYGGVAVTVPTGANYLFFGVLDSYHKDNTDPSGTLGVELVALSVAVPLPEPGTLFMLLTGVGSILALRRMKARRQ